MMKSVEKIERMTYHPYMVIYPGGNRALLLVSYVSDYEENQYDLASRKRSETENSQADMPLNGP